MFPKPKAIEGKVTLSVAERRDKRIELCIRQNWRCAYCGTIMSRNQGNFRSPELDHISPEPAGCSKNDVESNLQVLCHACNSQKGSSRL